MGSTFELQTQIHGNTILSLNVNDVLTLRNVSGFSVNLAGDTYVSAALTLKKLANAPD